MTKETSAKLVRTQRIVGDHMNDILACFVPGSKITVLVRQPDYPDRDFVMTNDDLGQVEMMVKRRIAEAPTP